MLLDFTNCKSDSVQACLEYGADAGGNSRLTQVSWFLIVQIVTPWVDLMGLIADTIIINYFM